jgi:hypothetical protein
VKSVRVDLYREAIDAILHELAGKDVMRVTLKVLNRAKVKTPVDTGNLRAAHQMRFAQSSSKVQGEVFNKVKYALPVHEGRKATVIYPRTKKALKFTWHGEQFVRKSVSQPARPGRPWLRDALREVAAAEGYKMETATAADA